MNNPFKGSGVALVTPVNDDLTIDFTSLRKLVNYQIENGTDFLVVQGDFQIFYLNRQIVKQSFLSRH